MPKKDAADLFGLEPEEAVAYEGAPEEVAEISEEAPVDEVEQGENPLDTNLKRSLPLLVIDQEFLDSFGKYNYSEDSRWFRNTSFINPEDVPTSLVYIADILYDHRMYLNEIDNVLQNVDRVISEIEILSAPEGGWPGSNETARRASKDLALLSDDEYQVMLDVKGAVSSVKSTVLSVIQSAEDARRALEYVVSHSMSETLRERNMKATYSPALAVVKHANKEEVDEVANAILEELGHDTKK